MRTRKTTILIVDDHELFRKGLIRILKDESEFSVIGEASDGKEGVDKALAQKPDIILMDILLPKLDGVAAAQRIRKHLSEAKILFLTALGHKEHIFQAIRMGATGYLQKEIGSSTLLSALKDALKTESFLCPTLSKDEITTLVDRVKEGRGEYERITTREREILKHMCEGKTSKEIASILDISPKTVDNHKANIMAKLGLHTRAQLVKFALRKGIIDLKV